MRTQTNTTEKITKACRISVLDISPPSPTIVVLILTSLKRTGGET